MEAVWTLISNGKSGSAEPSTVSEIATALESGGKSVRHVDAGSRDAEALAREAAEGNSAGIVVAAGDGTVMRAVNGIVKSQRAVPLGIVPLGTANIIARSLDIPVDSDAATKVILAGCRRKVDLGSCNGEVFALGAGLGLAERFVTRTSDDAKKHIGPAAYLISLIRELRGPLIRFHLRLDDNKEQSFNGVALVVANAGGLGHGFTPVLEAQVDDGLLDVCLVKRLNFFNGVRLIFNAARGLAARDEDMEHFQSSLVEVRSEPPVPIQMDGDICDQTSPFRMTCLPGRLEVFVPFGQSARSAPSVESR